MSQIEFEATVEHGTIKVPKEYRDRISGRVRIIIISDEDDDQLDMVEYLMQHPLMATDPTPFSRDAIYDRS